MRACPRCGAMVHREYDHGSSAGWTCEPARTERDAEIERRKHAEAIFDAEAKEHAETRLALRDLRAAVLAVAVRIDGIGFEFTPTLLARAWARALREACGGVGGGSAHRRDWL